MPQINCYAAIFYFQDRRLVLFVVDDTDHFVNICMQSLRFSIREYVVVEYFCWDGIGKDHLYHPGMYQFYHTLFSDDLVLVERTVYGDIIGDS